MSSGSTEPSQHDRLEQRPALDLSLMRETNPRDLLYRFLAGALTSIVAGLITLAFGARTGGILLAFPAILGASLTLIEAREDSVDACEDARGAIVGGAAMTIFALAVALLAGSVAGWLVLLVALLAWLTGALGAYVLLWLR